MKSVNVKLKIDPKIFEATQQFMEEKGLHIEMELSDSVDRFYEKYVPAPVRKYIERTTPTTSLPSTKPPAVSPNEQPKSGSAESDFRANSSDFSLPGSGGVNNA